MRLTIFVLFVFSFAVLPATAQVAPQPTPNVRLSPGDCAWAMPPSTSGRGRRAMKSRTAKDTASYKLHNGGKAINLAQWFTFSCGLSSFIPSKPPEDMLIDGAENITVTLTGYVMAVKFMRGGDHDLHVELGETADWNSDHVVVEMSPGKEYCKARAALWKIAEKDGCKSDECILKKPVKVEVKGYVLIGTIPKETTDYCSAISTRGLNDATHERRVRGIWRLQPVFALKKVR